MLLVTVWKSFLFCLPYSNVHVVHSGFLIARTFHNLNYNILRKGSIRCFQFEAMISLAKCHGDLHLARQAYKTAVRDFSGKISNTASIRYLDINFVVSSLIILNRTYYKTQTAYVAYWAWFFTIPQTYVEQ